MDSPVTYNILEREITLYMEGDREEEAGWDRETEYADQYTSKAEAIEEIQKLAARESVEYSHAREAYGIGSLTRKIYDVMAWTENEDGWVTCDEEGNETYEPVFRLDVLDLHPECKEAWGRAKDAYCRFLDYEDDCFGCVQDYLAGLGGGGTVCPDPVEVPGPAEAAPAAEGSEL